jgi:acetyl-CoA acetyltransferase
MTGEVAVVGFAQTPVVRHGQTTTSGVEMLVPILRQALDGAGLTKGDVDFWCSGSSDYLAGRAFSFVTAVDALGAYPPIMESHVEMDGAWAMHEAWVKILTGEAGIALVYAFGKASAGDLRRVLALQLDPYVVAPLWPDPMGIAALQARLGLESGAWSEKEMAAVAARSRASAAGNPFAQISGETTVDALLDAPYVAEPLRAHDCAPIGDGAAVLVLANAEHARRLPVRPAWITGFAHRIDPQALGLRDLTTAPSAREAARAAGLSDVDVDIDVAELHAPFTHQELILRRELGLGEGVRINPSGGALCANPMFAAGLARIGGAATEIMTGRSQTALGHATSGPALQQNLVCVMSGQDGAR